MKSLSIFYAILSIAVGVIAWQFTKPLFATGTSVIYEMSERSVNRIPAVKLPNNLSLKQHELLKFAYDVAQTDGMKNPRYLQGILMQESHACEVKNYRVSGLENRPGDRYFGCGQIKLVAAKDVMSRYPDMWKYLETRTDEELQARLILDDKFNIRVASKYALLMGINTNPTKAITAYNLGQGGAKEVDPELHGYTVSVKQHMQRVSKQNVHQASDGIQLPSKPQTLAYLDTR